jgi:glycosyltransferase 2 family protein
VVSADDDQPNRSSGGEDDRDEGGMDLRGWLLTRRTLVSAVLAVALLFLLFSVLLRVDAEAMLDHVRRADPLPMAGAFLAHYLTFPLRGLRWRYLLVHSGIRVSARDAVEIFCLSWFVNVLAPARLGDVYRAYLLRTHLSAPLPKTVGTLVIERVADILGVFALAVAAGLWSFRGRVGPEVEWLLLTGIGIAISITILVAVLRMSRDWVARHLPRRLAPVWHGFQEGAAATLTPGRATVVTIMTMGIWLLEGLRLYLVVAALDLPELGIAYSAAVFVALIGALFSILPLTPAGIGFVEGGIVYALTVYGVTTDAAAAATLADRTITLISVLILGSVLYAVSPKGARRGVAA